VPNKPRDCQLAEWFQTKPRYLRIAKQHGALPNPRDHIYLNIFPRTLDVELRAHSKGMAADFDFKKMSFVLEACGTLHNEQIEQAQSKTASALKKSLASAWELFSTNLEGRPP